MKTALHEPLRVSKAVNCRWCLETSHGREPVKTVKTHTDPVAVAVPKRPAPELPMVSVAVPTNAMVVSDAVKKMAGSMLEMAYKLRQTTPGAYSDLIEEQALTTLWLGYRLSQEGL